jgi:hypothetical protein
MINESHDIPCIAHRCGPHGATHVGMNNPQRPSHLQCPPHLEMRPYVACLLCMYRKTMSLVPHKLCQGSCHSPYFKMFEQPLCLNEL